MTGLTEDAVPRLLQLKGGRHTMRRWRMGQGIRASNLRRLLAIQSTLHEIRALVPDLQTFLHRPVQAGGPTPLDLIADGRDRAALGVALRLSQQPPRSDISPLRDVSGGPIAYMDVGGD